MVYRFSHPGKAKNEKGQVFVEFALLLPLLLLLFLGIVQFGILFYGQITVTSAAREGARLASIGKSDLIDGNIEDIIASNIFLTEYRLHEINIKENSPTDRTFTVTVDADADIIMPFLGKGNGVKTLSAQCSMRDQSAM